MPFEKIIGQARARRFLQQAFERKRLSHAFLFVGQSGIGKEAMALALAGQILTPSAPGSGADPRVAALTHPDLSVIFPSPAKLEEDDRRRVFSSMSENPYCRLQPWANPSISIHRVRELRGKAAYKSFEGHGRVVLILDCERMTTEAANALLKILEEPPDNMYLILVSSRPSLLLPTIKSRCQVLKFEPLATSSVEAALRARGIEGERARLVARLAAGSYRQALELLDEDVQAKQEMALEFLRATIKEPFLRLLYVDKLLQTFNRNLKPLRELLAHLLIWMRDLLVYRESQGKDPGRFVHESQIEVLRKFNDKFPKAELHAAIGEIERAVELLDRNVQANLILVVLLNKLHSLVRR